MSKEVEDRWIDPSAKCNLCKKDQLPGDRWGDEHWCGGLSGFNFTFCPECCNNRRDECDNVAGTVLANWKKHCEEYWATHPEELKKQRRETEEYRKSAKFKALQKKQSWFEWIFRLLGK